MQNQEYAFQIVSEKKHYEPLMDKCKEWIEKSLSNENVKAQVIDTTHDFFKAVDKFSFSQNTVISRRLIFFVYDQDVPEDIPPNEDDLENLCEPTVPNFVTKGYIFIILDKQGNPERYVLSKGVSTMC